MNDVLTLALLLADQAGDAATVDEIMKLVAEPDDAEKLAKKLGKKEDGKGGDDDSKPSAPFPQL